ncbi:class F sortase [Williamsia maris]|uniref:Sortase family protein n=1 Tax=Williamsia maris TaxID=72806 RepID=A0ABT1HIT5_9NOCA|nr:class F sortase [Williamsia maris]MCP2177837.1 Sortase family protein [Williamsia maris]
MRQRAIVCLVALTTVLAGCSSSPIRERPFPTGDTVAASKPLDTGVSAVPANRVQPVVPAHLYIPAIAVNSTILQLGTVVEPDPFLDNRQVTSFEVPPDLARAGWWSDGPRVGAPGMAVLLGHSQVGGGYAVFNRIGELTPGAELVVDDESGRIRLRFRVTSVVRNIPKNDSAALQKTLAANAPTSNLALVTCSGDFDSSASESVDNTVVFARRA